MRVQQWLKAAALSLEEAGIGSARLDCLILLEDIAEKDRSWLLAHPDHELSPSQLEKLRKQLKQRQQHIPLAYVRGKTEFYGYEFVITKDVLEPRPESETMIEMLLELDLPDGPKILDLGTGSGALAITAKRELPQAHVTAVDIDRKALAVAEENAAMHNTEIVFAQSDLLEAVSESHDVILANLPYVPNAYEINQAAANEPRVAIFGGEDGLDLYRRMFSQVGSAPKNAAYVLTESLPFQHEDLVRIASKYGFQHIRTQDLIQLFEYK